MKVIQPAGVGYINHDFGLGDGARLYVMFQYRLPPGKQFSVQYTSDGITYFGGGQVGGQPTFTIDPAQGLWPRIVEP